MFVFDTRFKPLYLQAFPPSFAYEEVTAHFDEMEAHFRAQPPDAPAALIADARSVFIVDARSRRRVAEAFETMSPVMESRVVAHAIVLSNSVVRNALTAIFWIKRPPWTVRTFATMDEADDWVRQRFAARGLGEVPAPRGWWHDGVHAKLQAASGT